MNVKTLNKNVKKGNNEVIITKTVEEAYTKQDLENALRNISRQKEQILKQNEKLLERFNQLKTKEQEIYDMIGLIDDETPTVLE